MVSACMFPISVFMKCVFTDHSAEKDAWGASFFPYFLFFFFIPLLSILASAASIGQVLKRIDCLNMKLLSSGLFP